MLPEKPRVRLDIRCEEDLQRVSPGDLRRLLRLQLGAGHDPHALVRRLSPYAQAANPDDDHPLVWRERASGSAVRGLSGWSLREESRFPSARASSLAPEAVRGLAATDALPRRQPLP
jgi:hypothetical protein